MQDAEKQFAKTRSEADKLKLETAQADYDNMVRNLKARHQGRRGYREGNLQNRGYGYWE